MILKGPLSSVLSLASFTNVLECTYILSRKTITDYVFPVCLKDFSHGDLFNLINHLFAARLQINLPSLHFY